jgi:hypothetical protein|tara:strand:+ start:1246 stop:1383 length:138 start_codon:yes stop_codon:yes gene_type:complete
MDKFDEEAFIQWKNYQESRTNFLPDWYKNASDQQRRQYFLKDYKG